MHVLKPETINFTRKNIQNVLTNIKLFIYIYIFIYYTVHCKRKRRSLCTNKALVVNERRPESVEPRWSDAVSKELNQMKSTVNSAAVRQRLAAAPPPGQSLNENGMTWHPVSKLACDGEGTLRFQGCHFSLSSILLYCHFCLIEFIALILVVLKKKVLFTNRIVLFLKCFFSEKTNMLFPPFTQ